MLPSLTKFFFFVLFLLVPNPETRPIRTNIDLLCKRKKNHSRTLGEFTCRAVSSVMAQKKVRDVTHHTGVKFQFPSTGKFKNECHLRWKKRFVCCMRLVNFENLKNRSSVKGLILRNIRCFFFFFLLFVKSFFIVQYSTPSIMPSFTLGINVIKKILDNLWSCFISCRVVIR